jgi:general secretion pathway protein G
MVKMSVSSTATLRSLLKKGIDTYFATSNMLKQRDPSRRNRLSVPVFQHPVRAPGKLRRGFTLIELMVVMAIISILIAISLPIYQKSMIRARESVLRSNLFTLRNVIDEYTVDKEQAPETLQDLVSGGYLRQIPQDPMTNSDQTWRITMEDAAVGGSNATPGIFDVHSGSDKTSLEGTPYADW